MKTNLLITLISVLFLLSCKEECSVVPVQLRCEYLEDPLVLDDLLPRLGWVLQATDENDFGQSQKAYQIMVSGSKQLLDNDNGDVWNPGWIESDQMQHIVYDGMKLQPDKDYFWKVRVKDEKGNMSGWSQPAQWSTGLLDQEEWTAHWIGTSEVFDPSQTDCNIHDPWMRKVFHLDKKPTRARIFVASVGYHEVYVNGKKIGDDVLAPCVSDHTKRARYVAYDIAGELQAGNNVIVLWLGTSWSVFAPYVTPDKPRTPLVIAQADIYDQDMNILRVQTDETWKTHPSPNKLLEIWDFGRMGGEVWDDNMNIKGWNQVHCEDGGWSQAVIYKPQLVLSAQNVEPNRLFQEIHPIAIEEQPDGSFRVDMGVNFAGWTEIKVRGNQGDRIDFLYSERQQDEMTFRNHSAFIIGESGKGTFRNRFNYSSGRWITIRGQKEKPQPDDIRGWMVRTAYRSATSFECSDPLQNWIYDRVRWTFENLSIGGYVVDCPQRERMGYGGDAHATSETGMFNYKLGAFYSKWMEDWRDVQGTESMVGNMNDPDWARKGITSGRILNNGVLPHTAPTYWGGGGPAWGGICVSLPWFMYQHEGDVRILEKNFNLIKGWLAFLDSHTKDGILQRFGGQWDFLGDWLWPGATAEGMNNDKPQTLCLNNCYRVFNLRTAVQIARILGHEQEAEDWEQKADESGKAIHERFYNPSDCSYADSSMANLAAALLGNIPPADLHDAVWKRLEDEILIRCNGHIDVGITGGAILFKVLRDAGRDDLIYSMTSKTDYPGWGFMKENGATTIWEMWEKDLPGHSLLHSSYLYPGAWYIDGVAGIRRDPDVPGFRRFMVRPPALQETQIGWAKAIYDSPAGIIRTAWQRLGNQLVLNVAVPPNCTATVYFPVTDGAKVSEKSGYAKELGVRDGYAVFEIPSGQFEFSEK